MQNTTITDLKPSENVFNMLMTSILFMLFASCSKDTNPTRRTIFGLSALWPMPRVYYRMTKMRQKRLKLSLLLLLGLGLTGLQAQTMHVKEISGTETDYALSNLRKMTFSEGNAIVQKMDNTTSVYASSGILYLHFTNMTTSIVEQSIQLDNPNLGVYPNPVNDVLIIDLTGIESEGTLRVLTFEGKLLQEQKTNGASTLTLNVSQLSQGIYLCLYNSGKEIKTIKFIKQ